MVRKIISVVYCLFMVGVFSQEDTLVYEDSFVYDEDTNLVEGVFESTRIINSHSTQTLSKGVLDFRVEHKFGDIAGDFGGVQTMYGLDNSTDIRLGFEYGLTDNLMVGVGRSKGSGAPYRSLLDGFLKYKIFDQKKRGMPISMSIVGTTTYTYMKASNDISQINSFPELVHRLAYCTQLVIARKFGSLMTLALTPSLVHRNYVATNDVNTLFALGSSIRVPLNSKSGIVLEYFNCFADENVRQLNTNSFSISYDWITFGHNFNIFLTNSKGFVETQYIPTNFERWDKGQFRIGFCIGRKFAWE